MRVVGLAMPFAAWADECPAGGAHDFAAQLVRQATDDEDGLRRFTCLKCGESFDQAIPATGHEWGPWVVDVEPTCSSEGWEHRVCAHDATHVEERAIAPLSATGSHTWVEVARADATCEGTGSAAYACSVCGAQTIESLPPLGHEWGAWEEVRPATAEAEGLERRACVRDASHVEERAIPLLAVEPAPPSRADSSAAAAPVAEPARSESSAAPVAPAEPDGSAAAQQENPWTPNALDAVLLGVARAARPACAVAAGPAIHASRWAAARRREVVRDARPSAESHEGGRVL